MDNNKDIPSVKFIYNSVGITQSQGRYKIFINGNCFANLTNWTRDWRDWILSKSTTGEKIKALPSYTDQYFSNFNHHKDTDVIYEEWEAFCLEFDIDF